MLQSLAIIPARMGARRLPGKPLLKLAGEPLIWRVYQRVCACPELDAIWVATDSPEIQACVESRGGEVIRVNQACDSGTERVAYAARGSGARWIINVQADQPLLDLKSLARLLQRLKEGAEVVTLAAPLPPGALNNPHRVKLVQDQERRALYFSRAAIPGQLHLGIYGFSAARLAALAQLPRSSLARAEDLEQLSWLEAGQRIEVLEAPYSLSIDTPADLKSAQERWKETL